MRLRIRHAAIACGWIVAGCVCLLLTSSEAVAQKPKPDAAKTKTDKPDAKKDGANQKPDGLAGNATMEIAKAEGKLEAMQQGVIKISTADKKEVFLQSGQETIIAYTAEADMGWLSPGVFVRFSANFDASGKPTAPLKSLEVFTPVVSRRLSPEQMREQSPGVYQEGKEPPAGAKNLFNGANNGANNKAPAARDKKEPTKKDAAKKDKKDQPAAGSGQAYRVVGQLGNVQDKMIMVIAGQPMQLELAPDCKISVTANELQSALSMATKGDSVTVSGLRNPAQPEIVMSEQITIKAAKKLTQPEMTGKRPGRPTRGNSKDKDADDKDNSKDKSKKPSDKKAKQ